MIFKKRPQSQTNMENLISRKRPSEATQLVPKAALTSPVVNKPARDINEPKFDSPMTIGEEGKNEELQTKPSPEKAPKVLF